MRSPFGQIQASPTTQVVPSSSALDDMIARAMRACDGDVEQTRLAVEGRHEARRLDMAARGWVAEVEAKRRRRVWGV